MVKSLDEVEDLTRFADESFDTDAVDLFEFTGNADSLLTRLKSIILSLDWEITNDILDELAEEIAYLRNMCEEDKVAQLYLQGLDKIGKYLRVEGAYAHHNAIKLLLTLFYDYEKIVSSTDISEDTITSLLKSDVRKFKVLQYQIGMMNGSSADSADLEVDITAKQERKAFDTDLLADIEATILELDWEITDEGLEKLNSQAVELDKDLINNKHAQILLQGLQVIGAYISEQKANAHPDAYTLLHSFYDGLKIIVTDNDLDNERRQEIIIGRVNQLNNLKEIIAGTSTTAPGELSGDEVDHLLDFGSQEQEEDNLDTVEDLDISDIDITNEIVDTIKPTNSNDQPDIDVDSDDSTIDESILVNEHDKDMGAVASFSDEETYEMDVQEPVDRVNAPMETANEHYPEEILDPDAIQPLSDEISDEFIEDELSISSKWRPALDDSDESETKFDSNAENINKEDLEDELDLLFGDEGETEKISNGIGKADDAELNELVTPALADADEEGGFTENIDSEGPGEEPSAELEDKLDSFFGVSDDQGLGKESSAELEGKLDSFFSNSDDQDQSTTGDEELVTPALADADEESGFTENVESGEPGEKPSAELEDKLDSFFGVSDDQDQSAAGDEEQGTEDDEDQGTEGDEELVTPALADADEEDSFIEDVENEGPEEEPSVELEDKLDSFFGVSDDDEQDSVVDEELVTTTLTDADEEGGFTAKVESEETGAVPSAELEDKLDSFFSNSDDQDQATTGDEELVTPALADADVEAGFTEEVEYERPGEEPSAELENKLDSFFATNQETETESATDEPSILLDEEIDHFSADGKTSKPDQENDDTIPALADADENTGFDEEEVVESLADTTDSAVEEIDGRLDSFFDMEKEDSDQVSSPASSTLSSLAAAAANLTSNPAANDLQQVAELVAIGKEEHQGNQQAILLTLIESAVSLLGKKHEAAEGSGAVVQELVSMLEDAENPNTLIEAVIRYTSWQKDFFDKSISSQKSTDSVTPSSITEVTDDNVMQLVQSGFSQLRSTLMNEFESIRNELKKK